MQTNQIIKGSGQKPLMVNSGKDLSGDVYMSHREFVGNVTAQYTNTTGATVGSAGVAATYQSTFNPTLYPVNAGIGSCFPWLSQIAQNFTLYEFEGLIFEYRPTSGEFGSSNSNSLGKVIMATNYDPDASPFVSSVQMENYDYATACKPAEHMLHGIETKSKQRLPNMLYVRTGTVTKDKVLTDLGLFQIGTEGVPYQITGTIANGASGPAINVGELWVTYKVKLSRANLFGTYQGNEIPMDTFFGYTNATTNCFDSTSAQLITNSWLTKYASPIPGYAASALSNTLGCTLQSPNLTTMTLTFPVNITDGYYLVQVYWENSTAANQRFAAANNFANCTLIVPTGVWKNTISTYTGTLTAVPTNPGGTGTFTGGMQTFILRVQAPGTLQASCRFNLNISSANTTAWQAVVTQVPASLISALV